MTLKKAVVEEEEIPVLIRNVPKPVVAEFIKLDQKNARNLVHSRLRDVSGKNAVFEGVDFSYAVIERGYFHNAKFHKCKFIGTRFTDCNFRSSQFSECKFKYCEINGTRIPTHEILKNLPDEPNIRRELLQTLRKNSISIGDVSSTRTFVLSEIDAKKEHLRRAWQGEDSYYGKKYSGFIKKLKIGTQRALLGLDSFLWGHGERLWKMPFSILVLLAFSATLATFFSISNSADPTLLSLWDSFANFFIYYTSLFLDVSTNVNTVKIVWLEWIISLCRYVAFGVLVAGLFRWFSHR